MKTSDYSKVNLDRVVLVNHPKEHYEAFEEKTEKYVRYFILKDIYFVAFLGEELPLIDQIPYELTYPNCKLVDNTFSNIKVTSLDRHSLRSNGNFSNHDFSCSIDLKPGVKISITASCLQDLILECENLSKGVIKDECILIPDFVNPWKLVIKNGKTHKDFLKRYQSNSKNINTLHSKDATFGSVHTLVGESQQSIVLGMTYGINIENLVFKGCSNNFIKPYKVLISNKSSGGNFSYTDILKDLKSNGGKTELRFRQVVKSVKKRDLHPNSLSILNNKNLKPLMSNLLRLTTVEAQSRVSGDIPFYRLEYNDGSSLLFFSSRSEAKKCSDFIISKMGKSEISYHKNSSGWEKSRKKLYSEAYKHYLFYNKSLISSNSSFFLKNK
jgi:hypothetical protein